MNGSKKLILGAILLVAAFTIHYWFSRKAEVAVQPKFKEIIKIAYKESVPSFPIFVGISQGYFQEQNLEVEPVIFESTNQMIEAVVRGDVDVSAVGSVEPALAAEATSPGSFKFYGQVQWSKENFLDFVLVKEDSPISAVQELEGKKIGVAPGGASVVYTKLFLQNFFDPEQVDIEQLDTKILIQALASGALDAIIGNEPLRTTAIQKGGARVLLERPYTDYVPYFAKISGVGLISAKLVKERPDIARRFAAAMNRSFAYGNAHPEEVRKTLPSCCGVTNEIAENILHLGIYSGSGAIDKDTLQEFADFLHEQKLISRPIQTSDLILRVNP